MNPLLPVLLALFTFVGCGGDSKSPTAPSTPITPSVTYGLSGTVTSVTGGGIANATVSVADGSNAGRGATTDGAGSYSLTLAQGGGFTVNVSAPGYEGTAKGFDLTPTNPRQTGNFTLYPSALWSRNGTGDMVFDMNRTGNLGERIV